MRLDISRSLVLAYGLTAALAATACGDDSGGGGGAGGGSAASTGDTSSTATGGTPDCTTLCATYGSAVPAVVDQIVADALADPMFTDDFTPLAEEGDARVAAFKTNLVNFISDAYGCTEGSYTGPSMEDAHTGQAITADEYSAFVNLCAGALVKKGVPEDYVGACFAPGLTADALKNSIIGK
jgi:hypothetical protein